MEAFFGAFVGSLIGGGIVLALIWTPIFLYQKSREK